MPAGENCAAAAAIDVTAGSHDDGQAAAGCSCLPFCFWGSGGPVTAPERQRRRRGFGLSLPWFSWPWLRKSSMKEEGSKKTGKKRRRMMLHLFTSLQAKKAFASVSLGSSLLPKVSSFGDAMKQSGGKPRETADDTAPTTSTNETAPARPETSSSQPCRRPAGGVWRAPSRRHSLRSDRGAEPVASLWTMATTLGVIVFFGRVTAVIFLCSCLYGARFVRAQASGAKAKTMSGIVAAGSSRRFGDQVAERVVVDLCTEEHKKKVIMEGLLDRTPSRGCRRAFVNNQQQQPML